MFSYFQTKNKESHPLLGELKPHAKIQNPRTTYSGKKVNQAKERREEEKNLNSGHLVPCSALKPLTPIAVLI